MRPGEYDRRVLVEYAGVIGKDPEFNTNLLGWVKLAVIWAAKQDELPSRAETSVLGVPLTRSRCRLRYRYRTQNDITTKMRMTFLSRRTWQLNKAGVLAPVVMQIISGPGEVAKAGRYREQEVMCELILT